MLLKNDCILPPTNLIFLAVAGGRSAIQTMSLLHRASTICLLAEFPAQQQQLTQLKTLHRSIEQTQYITLTRREMRTAELVVNRELTI
jgi:hypothetical protein